MMNELPSRYNLLMLSGDSSIAQGSQGAFYMLLARFSQYWNRIDVITPQAGGAVDCVIHDNVHIHPAQRHRVFQPWFIAKKGRELLDERPYHLVVSHDYGFFYNGIGAWMLLRDWEVPIPLISEIHHIEGYPRAVTLRERVWRFAAERYLAWSRKRVDAYRTVNWEVSDYLVQRKVEPQKVLRLSSLYMEMGLLRPVATDQPYDVLYVGRLARNKGVLLLLDAIAQLQRSTHPEIVLGIRGSGPLRRQVERRIARLGLKDHVVWIPTVPDSEAMMMLYNNAKVIVCASTVEGNPRVVAEAMACGIPVVSTRVGLMQEIIDNGRNGFLVDWDAEEMAEKIGYLLDGTTLRENMGEAGRDTMYKYQAHKTVARYAQTYHRVIEGLDPLPL